MLIYEYDNFFWLQKGDPIIGIENQQLGYKIDINNAEQDIIVSALTNAYTYVQAEFSVTIPGGTRTYLDDPTFGDPDHQTVEKQQQEIKTYIYDNATGEWDSNKFNTLYKPSTHIDANIKINDVGNKNCYYFKKQDFQGNDSYYFNVHVWPSGTVQVAETSVNVLNNEISTSSDVIIEGTLTANAFYGDGSGLTNISSSAISGLNNVFVILGIDAAITDVASGGSGTTSFASKDSPTFTGMVTMPDLTLTGNLYESDGITPRIFSNWTVHNNGNDLYRLSGNVGIGTTSPGYKLEVNGIAKLGETTVSYLKSHFSENTGLWFDYADTVRFVTSGKGRMWIASNGNVGIGTTSPDAKLEIYDNTVGSSSTLILRRDVSTSGNSDDGPVIEFKTTYTGNGMTQGAAKIRSVDETNDGYNGGLAFDTNFAYSTTAPDGKNDYRERMRISYNGNVGIGTQTPSEKLEIKDGSIKIIQHTEDDTIRGILLKNFSNTRTFYMSSETWGAAANLHNLYIGYTSDKYN